MGLLEKAELWEEETNCGISASRENEKGGDDKRKQDKAEAFAGFSSKGEMAFEEREKWIEEGGKLKEWVRDVEKVTEIK